MRHVALVSFVALGSIGAGLAACSSDPAPYQSPSAIDAGGGGGGDASAPPPGELSDAGEPVTGEPVVPFSIQDEADPGCVAQSTATPTPVAVPAGLVLGELSIAGTRRLARDISGKGVVLFDADGASPSPAPVTLGDETRASATASGVTVASVDAATNVVAQRFDANGVASGPPVTLGPTKIGRPLGVVRSGDTAFVTWVSDSGAVVGRIVVDGEEPGPVVTLESGAESGDVSFALSVLGEGADPVFAVQWALYRVALGGHRVYSARVGKQGQLGLTRLVFGDPTQIKVVAAVPRGPGVMLLTNVDGTPVVVPLDAVGRPVAAARRYLGAQDTTVGGGLGLATDGQTWALLGGHASRSHALRRVDVKGAPLDGWICLDAPRPDDAPIGGVVAEPGGWAAVIAGPSDTSRLIRVDATGRGPRP